MRPQTKAVHHAVKQDKTFNSVITPIYPSSTFEWDKDGTHRGYDYSRSGNPTRRALELNLAELEAGHGCRATATGMAAVTCAMHLLPAASHIITGADIYGGTYRLFDTVCRRMGLDFSFVDMTDPQKVRDAITPQTQCLWIETPSNPLLNLVDLEAMAAIAREHDLMLMVDNTFASPLLQRPLELGADVVVHSTTKYLNGHSDVVGGAIITAHEKDTLQVDELVNSIGLPCSPFDAWLVLRGIKTLGPRLAVHQANAASIAQMLSRHDAVGRIYYPGLEDHPQHDLARKQMSGYGGMVSFDLKNNSTDAAYTFMTHTRIFTMAESLGGVESLVQHPWTMSHASISEQARLDAGITQATLRLSVGIEDPADLLEDLESGLAAVEKI